MIGSDINCVPFILLSNNTPWMPDKALCSEMHPVNKYLLRACYVPNLV